MAGGGGGGGANPAQSCWRRTDELADVVGHLGSGHGAVLSLVGLLLRSRRWGQVEMVLVGLCTRPPCSLIASETSEHAWQRVQAATNAVWLALETRLAKPKDHRATSRCDPRVLCRVFCSCRVCRCCARWKAQQAPCSRGTPVRAQGLHILQTAHIGLRRSRACAVHPCKFSWAALLVPCSAAPWTALTSTRGCFQSAATRSQPGTHPCCRCRHLPPLGRAAQCTCCSDAALEGRVLW